MHNRLLLFLLKPKDLTSPRRVFLFPGQTCDSRTFQIQEKVTRKGMQVSSKIATAT